MMLTLLFVSPRSIGNSFFVTDGPAERMEIVLLIVPRMVKVTPK